MAAAITDAVACVLFVYSILARVGGGGLSSQRDPRRYVRTYPLVDGSGNHGRGRNQFLLHWFDSSKDGVGGAKDNVRRDTPKCKIRGYRVVMAVIKNAVVLNLVPFWQGRDAQEEKVCEEILIGAALQAYGVTDKDKNTMQTQKIG